MLRGRFSGENDDKNDNSPPDRLIHFEPEEGSSDSSQENGSVFGTYYKNIASDNSENDGSKLFGKKPSDNFGNPNTDNDESVTDDVKVPSAVTFQADDVIDEDLSESSFPLFLSFKANDPAKSISEALREKTNPPVDEIDERIDLVQEEVTATDSEDILADEFIDSMNDPFDIPLDELDVPIFKPLESIPVEENSTTYDIPKVFENDPVPEEPTKPSVSDSSASGNLFFPLSDDFFEPDPLLENEINKASDLSESSDGNQSVFGTNKDSEFSGKSSGFSFIPSMNDNPETPVSDAFSTIQDTVQPIDDTLPVIEEPLPVIEEPLPVAEEPLPVIEEPLPVIQEPLTVIDEQLPVVDDLTVSDMVSETQSVDLIEDAPIFAPVSEPFEPIADVNNEPISNIDGTLFRSKSFLSDFSTPEVTQKPDEIITESTPPPTLRTRGPSARVRNETVAAVLKDDGYAVFKEVNTSDNASGKSKEVSNSILTERPGKNYSSKQVSSTVSPSQKGNQTSMNLDPTASKYTAAQQMGTVAPLPQRYHKKSKRSAAPYVPIILLIIVIILFIGLWQAWSYFDLGKVFNNLFGASSEPKVSTFQTTSSTTSASSDTSDTTAPSETTAAPTPTSTPTPSPTPTTEPTETTPTTTAPTTVIYGDPTKFVTKILNGSSDGNTAYFDIRFENSGSYDSSLVDSLTQITITYESTKTIEEVTSSYFTFVKKEGSTNVFIGTPTSTEIILQDDFVLVDITGVTAGSTVGSFSIKYFIEYKN